MLKRPLVPLVIIVVLALIAVFIFSKNEEEKGIADFDECIAAGYPVMESYPRQCRTPEGENFTEYIGNELEKTDLIRISSPRPNQSVKSPLMIEGEARGYWFFEADFLVKLFDASGNLLVIGIARANPPAGGDWMTEDFVDFKAELNFDLPETGKGFLILEKDNPSALEGNADELVVPVKFGPAAEMMVIKVYFGNNELDPQISCDRVFSVEKEIVKTSSVARGALEELLKGTTKKEESEGFFTSINPGVKINKLTVEDGIAKVDFDERLEYQVGGSCRVSAIRAQISETLMQFPTVKDVVISVNGRIEDVLQP